MATISETTPEHELHRLLRERRILAFGLAWGFFVSLVFVLWFAAKERPILAWVLGFSAAAAFSIAARLFFAKGGQGAPETRLAKIRSEQSIFGLVLCGVGILLIIVGAGLVFSQKLEGLAMGLGLVLFGGISLVTGYRLLAKPQVPLQDRMMSVLGSQQKQIGLGLFILGALCILVALYLRLKTKPNPDADRPVAQAVNEDEKKATPPATIPDPADFPKWFGFLLVGFIGVGAGLRLYLAKEPNIRIMVLMVGGLTGLVIALMTLSQAWIWRETIIGGLPAWRGENGWRIWLCAYLELFVLGLMFGSFMLARADIRINPILRRVLYGYNAVFTGLLLLALLGVLNVVVYAMYPMSYDWSSDRGVYNISQSTRGILESLKETTTVYVLLSPRGGLSAKIYKDVKTLLENCRTVTDKLTMDYINPDQDFFRYETLAKRYPEILPEAKIARETEMIGRGLLIVYGRDSGNPKEKPPPNAFIASNKLFDLTRGFRGVPPSYTFKGEKVFRSELKFLTQGKNKIKVYFLQGDDELETKGGRFASRGVRFDFPMSVLGDSVLIDRLRNENYEVQGLTFGLGKDDVDMKYVAPKGKDKKVDVPEDASMVVVAGPSATMPQTTLDALDRYMQKDGRLVVLLDVIVDQKYTEMKTTGMETFLKKYNVSVGKDYVFRVAVRGGGSPDPFLVIAAPPPGSDNLLAKKFVDSVFPLKAARVVRPGTESPNFRAETLLEVGKRTSPIFQQYFWAEDSVRALDNPNEYIVGLLRKGEDELVAKMSREPIPVAVAVKDKEDRPRLVVFGDTEMAADSAMLGRYDRNVLVGEGLYFNLFVSTLNYLAARPDIGELPKPPKLYSLGPTVPADPLRYLPAWLMCLGTFGLGLGMWVVRRR
jgi:hypothetical protein